MLEDNRYRERLEKIELINIIGLDILYVDGISEFIHEYKNIQIVLIMEKIFIKYKKEILEIVDNNLNISFFILYSKNINSECSERENICFYEKDEFINEQNKLNRMEENIMEHELQLNSGLEKNQNLVQKQNYFLETNLGKVVNTALDIGIKAVLPNLIEDEVIDLKNTIFESGIKEGLKGAIESALNLGKSAIGIFTGEFENISQIQNAVKSGGLIDGISDLLDFSIKYSNSKGLIGKETANLLKQGKNTLLNTISSKIEQELTEQMKNIEKLHNYCSKWKSSYGAENFKEMETNFKNIEKYLNKITPLEKTITEARKIENLHNLIKNNGNNFNISETDKILAEKLAL